MMPGPPKITLDQESFKALASEVRVGVLKKLDERRQTVTDLSNLLGLSKPTLLEHLEKLQAAGLVKRVDEGRKWIYYELSDKGRKILHPERVSIVLALASTAGLAAIGAFYVVAALTAGSGPSPRSGMGNATTAPVSQYNGIGFPYVGGVPVEAVVAFVLAAACAGLAFWLYRRGKRLRSEMFSRLASE